MNIDIRSQNEQIALIDDAISKKIAESEGKYIGVYFLVRQSAEKLAMQK